MTTRTPVLRWYDLLCPFCYVAQGRNAVLARHGFAVVEMAFQIHPEIPEGGIPAGIRAGSMYAMLEREAAAAGLPLDWPPRLPNTRPALAAAEWARRRHPGCFPAFRKDLFAAHFARREDIGDGAVIGRHASEAGIDAAALKGALASGDAQAMLSSAEAAGRWHGTRGTPAWFLAGELVSGLVPAAELLRRAADGAAPGDGPG